jgi:hypothetical protein
MAQPIEIGYQAFVDDADEEFGAVRGISADGREISVYIENTGELAIPSSAVCSIQSQKVTFACAKLDPRVRKAIGHAHDSEEPGL